MFRTSLLALAATASITMLTLPAIAQSRNPSTTAQGAPAQGGQVSFEQAWALCLKYVNENYPGSAGSASDHQRTAQGIACLARFGYRP